MNYVNKIVIVKRDLDFSIGLNCSMHEVDHGTPAKQRPQLNDDRSQKRRKEKNGFSRFLSSS